jgi:hypothetical protein
MDQKSSGYLRESEKVRLNKLATASYDFTVRKAVYISGLFIDSFFNGTSRFRCV